MHASHGAVYGVLLYAVLALQTVQGLLYVVGDGAVFQVVEALAVEFLQ